MCAAPEQRSDKSGATLGDRLFALFQLALPTHLLSRVVHWFLRLEIPWIKNFVIGAIMRSYAIGLDEAVITDPRQFVSFNDFFTRALRPEHRPAAEDAAVIASPVDGFMYQYGEVENGRIFQAKGQSFDLVELLGGDAARAEAFQGGQFATVYLAPSNYHRIHMPVDGRLQRMVYVPGRLFSVNPATSRAMPNLFARNERVATFFETPIGPMALVLVGALFVGSIETVWAGEITPPNRSKVESTDYPEGAVTLKRGEEMGRFNMGSTVIVLFGPDAVDWISSFAEHQPLLMGETLAVPT